MKAVVSGVTDFMANFSSSFAPAIVGITDLLIHLAKDQMKKTASLVIEGEDLDEVKLQFLYKINRVV